MRMVWSPQPNSRPRVCVGPRTEVPFGEESTAPEAEMESPFASHDSRYAIGANFRSIHRADPAFIFSCY